MAQLSFRGTSKALAFVPYGDGCFSDFQSIPEVTIHHVIVETLVSTTGLHLHMGEFCGALHLFNNNSHEKTFHYILLNLIYLFFWIDICFTSVHI